jgi:hypothetical protein
MRHFVVLFIHLIAILTRSSSNSWNFGLTQLLQPGGARSLVAESLLLKHQLLILNRSRQRSPTLSSWDRILAGWMALLVRPTRLLRSAIVLKPSTLLALHKAMSKRKYRMLFSPNRRRKPGPKGPSADCDLKAVRNDCLTRRKSIRPCVPSHVAYEVGAARQQTVRSPRTMYPHSQEWHRNREATVYLPA